MLRFFMKSYQKNWRFNNNKKNISEKYANSPLTIDIDNEQNYGREITSSTKEILWIWIHKNFESCASFRNISQRSRDFKDFTEIKLSFKLKLYEHKKHCNGFVTSKHNHI